MPLETEAFLFAYLFTMQILNTNGSVYLLSPTGKKVEVIKVLFAEYYNPAGTTPQQLQVNVFNPEYNSTDCFYFLNERSGIVYNSIQTNESAMQLLELYMRLILRRSLTPPQFIAELLKNYFAIEGYELVQN